MEHLIPKIDKSRVARFIVSNAGGSALSDDFNRSSFLGAKAAGIAQRMRQTLVGDAETTDRLLEAGALEDPVANLAAQIESAHLSLAMSRQSIGLMAFAGATDSDSEDVDEYFESLTDLFALYNDGVDLLEGLTGEPRALLIELIEPLRDELTHANKIYRKRLLGLF